MLLGGAIVVILKKIDILLIVFFILFSFGLIFIFVALEANGQAMVIVSADGQEVLRFNPSQNIGSTFEIASQNGTNKIYVDEGGAVSMIYASCPDHLCLNQGAISFSFQSIVCLPNRVVVQLMQLEEAINLDAVISKDEGERRG